MHQKLAISLDLGRSVGVLGSTTVINLPDIGVKSCEIDVQDGGVSFQQSVELPLRKNILLLVEVGTCKQEIGVSFGHTGDVGLEFAGLLDLLDIEQAHAFRLLHWEVPVQEVLVLLGYVSKSQVFFLEEGRQNLSPFLLAVLFLDHLLYFPLEVYEVEGGGAVEGGGLKLYFCGGHFGLLLDDGLIPDLVLWSEVVGDHVVAQFLEELLLEDHGIEVLKRVAQQLNETECTILSSSPYWIPPAFSIL